MAGRYHAVTGEITSIDREQGRLGIRTDRGPVELVFPPVAVLGLREGDRVTIDMALREPPGVAASPKDRRPRRRARRRFGPRADAARGGCPTAPSRRRDPGRLEGA
jgi:hypothetical protein